MLINFKITGKIIKKILRFTVLVIVVLLTGLLTIFSVLRTPSFQEMAGRLAANYLSKQFKTEIFLDKLRISDFLFIEIHGLQIKDNHYNEMIRIDELRVKINRLSLKQHVIEFERVSLDSVGFFLEKYPGDSVVNFDYFFEGFKSDTLVTSDTVVTWSFFSNELIIDDLTFRYRIDKPDYKTEGIDYNNLLFTEVFLDIKDVSIIGDSLAAFIDHVACKEKSGIELLNLSGDARVSSSGIRVKGAQVSSGQSSLDLDLDFLYNGYDKLAYFLDSVSIHSVIRSSLVTLSDVGYFAPEMFAMDDPVMLSGIIDGPISDFSARELKLSLGEFTEFQGSVRMKGLPDIYLTYVRIDIEKLNTTIEDIEEFNLPLENPNLILPSQVKQMGFISINGYYDGAFDDFKADLNLNSDAGDMKITGSLSRKPTGNEMVFSGKILGEGIQLGNILGSEELGTVNIELELDGHGSTLDNLEMTVNGWVQDLEYKKYRYEKIIIGGQVSGRSFDGKVMVIDPALNLAFNGLIDFSGTVPVFDFNVEIDQARFYELNLSDRSNDMDLKGNISGDFKGIDPESFYGTIFIDSLQYVENEVKYSLNHLELTRTRFPGQQDSIKLRSDYIDGDIEGDFILKDLISQFTGFILGKDQDAAIRQDMEENPQNVSFDFRIKDISPITGLFLPELKISAGTVISGKFDSGRQFLEVNGLTDTIAIGGVTFKWVSFSGWTAGDNFNLDIGILRIDFQKNEDGTGLGLDNFTSQITTSDDSINYAIQWDNNLPGEPNKGFIDGFIRFASLKSFEAGIYNAEANFNNNIWRIEEDNLFSLDSSGISIKNFIVFRDEESFIIDGSLSDRADDTLSLYFEKWSLANFNPFLTGKSLELSGIIDGRFGLFRNGSITNIFADLYIADFSFNEVLFGDAEFKTRWLESDQGMAIDLNIFSKGTMEEPYKILSVSGVYYPFSKTKNFDLDIAAQNMNISVLEPLLTSFSSQLSGFATGKLTLDGTNAKPLLLGRLKLQRAEMKVDYLNVMYSFSNEVVFLENIIQFNELTVYDPNSHTAVLTGGIKHTYFKDMGLDLTIKPVNFMAMDLNRYQNEVFYGKAFATGTVRLSGPFTNLSIEVDVKTDKNTQVTIPINYSADISQTEFIVFTGGEDTIRENAEKELQVVGVSLDISMKVTKDADIEIILPGNIGNIRAKGDGQLRLGVDPNYYLTLNGTYIIQSGLFVFSLEQLVSRRFDILEGSKISWTGDIYDAEVNIVARYRLRTSLEGLGLSTMDPDAASQKVIVFTDIRMSGNLFNPELSFGITFPNMAEQTKQAAYAVLDTNDKGLMNQQAISLLVLGSFSSTGTGGTNPVNPAAIVSNTLSNMLSKISNDFNVGINYMPGDQVTDEQLEVALSTQLLDDRLIIDGNIDVYGSSNNTQKTSSIVGDINIEYKLTPDGRFRVKAFNRSNDLTLINDYAPYTQGVGVFYRKEFNTLPELFRKYGSTKQQKQKK